jgi:hypothetical protein
MSLTDEDGIDGPWERRMDKATRADVPDVPRRRRRTTPATVKIVPVSMADIAAAFAEAMKVDRE